MRNMAAGNIRKDMVTWIHRMNALIHAKAFMDLPGEPGREAGIHLERGEGMQGQKGCMEELDVVPVKLG